MIKFKVKFGLCRGMGLFFCFFGEERGPFLVWFFSRKCCEFGFVQDLSLERINPQQTFFPICCWGFHKVHSKAIWEERSNRNKILVVGRACV